jgi:hypothetical protein
MVAQRGSGAVVAHHLAKVRVAGSNPVFRSIGAGQKSDATSASPPTAAGTEAHHALAVGILLERHVTDEVPESQVDVAQMQAPRRAKACGQGGPDVIP